MLLKKSVLWCLVCLAYAISLSHELMPHHHHQESHLVHKSADDHAGHADQPASDTWFVHQHHPGLSAFGVYVSGDESRADLSFVAVFEWKAALAFTPRMPRVYRSLFKSKAPPGYHTYRQLRAPPAFIAG